MSTHLAEIIDIAARAANINRDLIATQGIEKLGLLSEDLVRLAACTPKIMLTHAAADVLRVRNW